MNNPFPNAWRKRDWLFALLLAVATFLVYQPAWNGGPIFDDDDHLTPPELASSRGLARIWTEIGAVSQYYPLTHTVFWLGNKLWGHAMAGYHALNIILHVGCALLLVRVLQRLEISGAWFAAGIFALHPVHVESVAYVSELKNTLSGIFYFGAALAYLNFDAGRRKIFYIAALAMFCLGLLSKTVVATLPAALLVAFWWKRGSLSWKRDISPVLPFLTIGICAGLFTAWIERKFIGAEGAAFELSWLDRILFAGRAIWFYLAKLLWPADLIFIYPRWQISAALWQFAFAVTALGVIALLWLLRKRTRGPLAAMLLFIGTLFPALGFLNVYPFKYSFVADHYAYLASIGPIVLLSAVVGFALRRSAGFQSAVSRILNPRGGSKAESVEDFHAQPTASRRYGRLLICVTVAGVFLLVVLAILSSRQSRIYRNAETLWLATLERNPDCYVAHSNLGNLFLHAGDPDAAIRHCQAALELEPDLAEAHNNLANALLEQERLNEAVHHYQRAVELRPDFAVAHFNLGALRLRQGGADEALACFQRAVELRPEFVAALNNLGSLLLENGARDEAMKHFRKVLELLPEDADANNNLGNALLQSGDVAAAMTHYEKALRSAPSNALAHCNLGYALLLQDRTGEAIGHFQRAVALEPEFFQARYHLANALAQSGRDAEALEHFRAALKVQPNNPTLLATFAWLLATSSDGSARDGAEAVKLAQRANQLCGGHDAMALRALAAAFGETGKFPQAIGAAEKSLALIAANGDSGLASALRSEIQLYERGLRIHESNLSARTMP